MGSCAADCAGAQTQEARRSASACRGGVQPRKRRLALPNEQPDVGQLGAVLRRSGGVGNQLGGAELAAADPHRSDRQAGEREEAPHLMAVFRLDAASGPARLVVQCLRVRVERLDQSLPVVALKLTLSLENVLRS